MKSKIVSTSVLMLAVAGLMCAGATDFVGAQQVGMSRLSGAPTCKDCEITRELRVRLGDREGGGFVSPIFRVSQGHVGYMVTTAYDPARIKLFDRQGEYLRSVGGPGSGPGEFRFIRDVLVTPDGIVVFDASARRLTRYSETFDLLGTAPIEYDPYTVAVLEPDGFAVSATIRTRELAGSPLHVVDSIGQLRLSMRDRGEVFRMDVPWSGLRLITTTPDGHIWAMPRTSYVLQQWDRGGRKVTEVHREVAWFPPHTRNIVVSEETPPPPLTEGIHVDAAGRLWTAVLVADPEWQTALGPGTPGSEHPATILDENDYWDTIFEVLDLQEGVVVARLRIDEKVEHFLQGSSDFAVLRYVEDQPTIEVWGLTLDEPTYGARFRDDHP